MKSPVRSIFYVSDHTAVTAESLGKSLIAQFPDVQWNQRALPYVGNRQAALRAVQEIDERAETEGAPPIVIDTLVNRELSDILATSRGHVLDIFRTFLPGLESEIGFPASAVVGAQGGGTTPDYADRIDAIQYSMEHDDGRNTDRFHQADIVLLGVSRTGKTPTCLYIAIQFGLRAANYPLTEDELSQQYLPAILENLKGRLFGLSIEAGKLSEIRTQRWPGSEYADLANCQREIRELLEIYRRYSIPMLDVTRLSIEEVAALALEQLQINRTAQL